MKLRLVLFALMIAFPVLYVAGAVTQSEIFSAIALAGVAVVCCWLLLPERKQ